jgi:hypothetical protein
MSTVVVKLTRIIPTCNTVRKDEPRHPCRTLHRKSGACRVNKLRLGPGGGLSGIQ